MKKFVPIVLFVLAQIAPFISEAQNAHMQDDQIYGLNPQLYNGKYYSFFLPPDTKRTPFLKDSAFLKGSVTINNTRYDHLSLNYDIYNQQLILRYKTRVGNTQLIIISDAWLQSFTLGDKHFERIKVSDTSKRIFQVLGEGKTRILYYWRKNLALSNSYGATNFVFSKPVRKSFIQFGNTLMRYGNNKHFIRLFTPDIQAKIAKYLHRNRVNVKKSDDRTITRLIRYCNTITIP